MFKIEDFYPTPEAIIEVMLNGIDIRDKVFLEPSAGKGDIVNYLKDHGAREVIGCEINPTLQEIVKTKCRLIAEDFLTVTSDQISHIDGIIMNPPFSNDEDHILHAFEIAPAGCIIRALCNSATISNYSTKKRAQLKSIIEAHGHTEELSNCFADSERRTGVYVTMVTLRKPGESYSQEFEGFFLDEDEPENTAGASGIISYNVVRDLVNRYVAAVKLYDKQLALGTEMHDLLKSFYGESLTFTCNKQGTPLLRNEFKKGLQRDGWKFIFAKMDMAKYTTRGVREDINKFIEQQLQIPFTMKNIYKMLEIVVGTAGQRMDKAILDAFDNIIKHHDNNRDYIKGFKTNSHFLLGKKFIMPYMVDSAKKYGFISETYSIYSHNSEIITDLEKALCFCNAINYDEIVTLHHSASRNVYGQWYECEFFRYKAFKVGTVHFEFKNLDILAKLNQKVSKLKGYPLFEGKEQTKYQNKQTGRATQATFL